MSDRAARRLVLGRAEWAVLAGCHLTAVPPAFRTAPGPAVERAAAAAALTRRGVLTADGAEPVPAVAADLAVLRRPVLTVRVEVTGRGASRSGWFALGSDLVVAVLALPDGSFELSVAPAVRLGAELARAVPDAGSVIGAGEPGRPVAAPSGPVPLALLEGHGPEAWADPAEVALAEELLRRTSGSLSALLLGRAGGSGAAGQVSWLATDGGWVGLRPRPGGAPRRVVDVVPVRPVELGAWVAPTVSALLEASDDLR